MLHLHKLLKAKESADVWRGRFHSDFIDRGVKCKDFLRASIGIGAGGAAQTADGDGLFLALALADDPDLRDLGEAMFPYFIVNFLVTQVYCGTDTDGEDLWEECS